MSVGENNLATLLQSMSPQLLPEDYVFCTQKEGVYGDYAKANPLATFREKEGLTLILEKDAADAFGFNYHGIFQCITLTVHSSLDAVGLTAAVSSELAQHNISANVVAAFYHDHVFVPKASANQAVEALKQLADKHHQDKK